MAKYDNELDVYFIDKDDLVYLDNVLVDINDDGTDFDEDTAWFDEAAAYFVDIGTGESFPILSLQGTFATKYGIEKDDPRYGKMFIMKGE